MARVRAKETYKRPRRCLVESLLLMGFSNKEIAERMEITEKTVKDHTWRIFKANKVHSRFELMVKRNNERQSDIVLKRVLEEMSKPLE